MSNPNIFLVGTKLHLEPERTDIPFVQVFEI